MHEARDWVPPGATLRDNICDAIQVAVADWSKQWIARRSLCAARITERDALLPDEGWLRPGAIVSLKCARPAQVRLLEPVLDLRFSDVVLSDLDRQLIFKLSDQILTDLAVRVEQALELSGQAQIEPLAYDRFLEIIIADGSGPQLVAIAVPVITLAKLYKHSLPAKTRAAPLSSIQAELTTTTVTIEAFLGRLEVSMVELASLEKDDILVLDTALDQPLNISLLGSQAPFAKARLTEYEGEIALSFQTRC